MKQNSVLEVPSWIKLYRTHTQTTDERSIIDRCKRSYYLIEHELQWSNMFQISSLPKERIVELRILQKQCEIEMGWDPPQDYLDEWVKTVQGIHKQDLNLVKAAVVDDKIAGYCILVKKLHNHKGVVMDITWNSTYIWDLFVSKEQRNKGIGTKLLNDAVEYSKSIGCDRTGLLVNYQNENAKRLFEKAGFRLSSHYLIKRL